MLLCCFDVVAQNETAESPNRGSQHTLPVQWEQVFLQFKLEVIPETVGLAFRTLACNASHGFNLVTVAPQVPGILGPLNFYAFGTETHIRTIRTTSWPRQPLTPRSLIVKSTMVSRLCPPGLGIVIGSSLATTLAVFIVLKLSSPHSKIVPSPRETQIPRISKEEQALLPYPPDVLPGARDVTSPVRHLDCFAKFYNPARRKRNRVF